MLFSHNAAAKAHAKCHALANDMLDAPTRGAPTRAFLTPPTKWLTKRCMICVLQMPHMAPKWQVCHKVDHDGQSVGMKFQDRDICRFGGIALRNFHADLKRPLTSPHLSYSNDDLHECIQCTECFNMVPLLQALCNISSLHWTVARLGAVVCPTLGIAGVGMLFDMLVWQRQVVCIGSIGIHRYVLVEQVYLDSIDIHGSPLVTQA